MELGALLHDEADGGEHAHAAVRQLALAVPVDLELRLAVEEAVRVELERAASDDVVAARKAV
eukprot:scaffold45984_cov57-Phaeocystis_antarctica.AAC.2